MSVTITPIYNYAYNKNGSPAALIEFDVKSKKGKYAGMSGKILLPKEVALVATHPDVRTGGFTQRYNDPVIEKFMDGIGSICMAGSEAEKEAIERNKLRIFSSGKMEDKAREQLNGIARIMRALHNDCNVPIKKIKDAAVKALTVALR